MTRNDHDAPVDAWRRVIREYIAANPGRPHRVRGLAKTLDVPDEEYTDFRRAYRHETEQPASTGGRKGGIEGVFRATRRGHGFLEREGRPDMLIPQRSTGGAAEGDRILARVSVRRGPRGAPVAEVVRVLERAALHWVGQLERHGERFVVRPEGGVSTPIVEIADAAHGARPGDLVVVEPLPDTGTGVARGVIVERLGDPTSTEVRILGVMRQHGVTREFPDEVRREAQAHALSYHGDVDPGRDDLTDVFTLTIDPVDAKDFDDAISLERLPDGHVRLGVHVADVAHFVDVGSELDEEAKRRGTSVYFPGVVAPMLPESLSNGVCSLQEGQPRYAKTVWLTYGPGGKRVKADFANSLVRVDARLAYEEASAIIDGAEGEWPEKVVSLVRSATTLAKAIQRRRQRQGMITLNIPEMQIVLDDEGQVIGSRAADTSYSHTVIEMFMVEANEAVATMLTKRGVAHIRRAHEPPPEQAADQFARVASALGLPVPQTLDAIGIRKVLDAVQGKPGERTINMLLLRSLTQAQYVAHNEGHFALGSDAYCHFTSPIRRYPDLVVHRLLDRALRQDKSDEEWTSRDALRGVAIHCSKRERKAVDAERDAKNLLALEWIKSRIGETFPAVVSGLTRSGLFVQMDETLIEGFVPIEELPGEWYYDDATLRLFAVRGGRTITLGQALEVTVAAVDPARRNLLLTPADPGSIGLSTNAGPQNDPRRARPKAKSSRGPARVSGRKQARAPARGRTKKRGHQGP
ncbi:MAG: VacB/RNase II family 3'-5' exoribonuclease [Phycisphaerales bacterium]|nr:VacB/RNase II family 3'-5' exoribonuclease [Phycisphaerales bacterium]